MSPKNHILFYEVLIGKENSRVAQSKYLSQELFNSIQDESFKGCSRMEVLLFQVQ